MRRIELMDGSWFDADKATIFDEASIWDVNHFISAATKRHDLHEMLALTATGSWIKRQFTNKDVGSLLYGAWAQVSPEEANVWLAANGHQDAIPTDDNGEMIVAKPVGMFSTRLPTPLMQEFKMVTSSLGWTLQDAVETAFNDFLAKLRSEEATRS